jgi:F-type H+-transporting ATPase subunit epsilon
VADDVFGLEVVTPEQSLVAGGAKAVVLATSEGDLTVLDGHTPLVGDVVPGLVKVDLADGTELRLAVHGGFLQVDTSPGAAEGLAEGDGPLPGLSTRVTVLAGIAELSGEIDVPRAERAREPEAGRLTSPAARGPILPCKRPKRRWAGPSSGCAWLPAHTNETELNSDSLAKAWLA